jgi:hypothetical protein
VSVLHLPEQGIVDSMSVPWDVPLVAAAIRKHVLHLLKGYGEGYCRSATCDTGAVPAVDTGAYMYMYMYVYIYI